MDVYFEQPLSSNIFSWNLTEISILKKSSQASKDTFVDTFIRDETEFNKEFCLSFTEHKFRMTNRKVVRKVERWAHPSFYRIRAVPHFDTFHEIFKSLKSLKLLAPNIKQRQALTLLRGKSYRVQNFIKSRNGWKIIPLDWIFPFLIFCFRELSTRRSLHEISKAS